MPHEVVHVTFEPADAVERSDGTGQYDDVKIFRSHASQSSSCTGPPSFQAVIMMLAAWLHEIGNNPAAAANRRCLTAHGCTDIVSRLMMPAGTIDSEAASGSRFPVLSRVLLLSAASLVLVLSTLRVVVFWRNQAYLHPQSGVWVALAYDLARGAFYRPLDGPLGYGGSRYFPLPFVLHASLMKITGEPVWSGHAVSLLSVLLLMSGVYVLLRRVGARPVLAASAAVFVLAPQIAQDVLLSIKGDGFAAALGIWGVAICLPAGGAAPAVYAAAALFTLAFASKATAVSGLMAAVLGFAVARRWRAAFRLSVATAAGFGLVLVSMYLLSDGHAFEALRAGGGQTTLRDILQSPLTLARLARQEPETLVFMVIGFAAFLTVNLSGWRAPDCPSLLLIATLAVTTAVFSFEGTDTNHLLDLFVAALVMTAAAAARDGGETGHRHVTFAPAALVVAALAASLSLVSGLINREAEQRWGTIPDALSYVHDTSRPILAENPILSVARHEQPYVLDPFMFRLVRERNPPFGDPLWQKLRQQQFAAVILDRDPHTDRGRDWYRAFFGEGFVDEMERHYVVRGHVRSRVIYVPRER